MNCTKCSYLTEGTHQDEWGTTKSLFCLKHHFDSLKLDYDFENDNNECSDFHEDDSDYRT